MAGGPQMVGGSNPSAPAGGVSGGPRPDLESKASQSLICGLISLVCSGIGVVLVLATGRVVTTQNGRWTTVKTVLPEGSQAVVALAVVAAVILGIVALVSGSRVKKLAGPQLFDPVVRGKANNGLLLGRISFVVLVLGWIVTLVRQN